jgi:hypothetical protein
VCDAQVAADDEVEAHLIADGPDVSGARVRGQESDGWARTGGSKAKRREEGDAQGIPGLRDRR